MHLVFTHENGDTTAIPVNTSSTVNVKTWRPANFSEDGGHLPELVEDQTVSLQGVVTVGYDDQPPVGAVVLAGGAGDDPHDPQPLSDEEAARLDAQFDTVPNPWEA